MAYKIITYDNVSKCIGYPTNKEIDLIYNIVFKKTYDVALQEIGKIITNNQYLLLDIINEIHLKLKTNLIDRFYGVICRIKDF